MKFSKSFICVASMWAIGINASQAALTIDRSRLVINEGEKSVSLSVTNRNVKDPYLAQGWIENSKEEKINGPLMVLPPVQRMEPDSKTVVRVQALADITTLPKDKESVFYFNLREIPPKNEKPNVLTLAMQTRIKIFYRPKTLIVDQQADYVPGTKEIILKRQGNMLEVINPTPYHFTFVDARNSVEGQSIANFEPVMVEPKEIAKLNVPLGNAPVLTFINDFGSQRLLQFTCGAETCKVKDIVVPKRAISLTAPAHSDEENAS